MDIMLVTSSFNNDVHGSDDEKKTGCGIILTRPENVTKYHRGGRMTDLKEITCEKCKERLAKKIIKADKKEMARILREEKLMAKRGLGDVGIVPLGNTTAKITSSPEDKKREAERLAAAQKEAENARRDAEDARREAEQARRDAEAARAAEEAAKREAEETAQKLQRTIPGTGVAIDDSLAQFAINVPKEEPQPEPEMQEDFLTQFAIQKPDEEMQSEPELTSSLQDDFLAQFAVPSPAQQYDVPDYSVENNATDTPQQPDVLEEMPNANYGYGEYSPSPVDNYENNSSVVNVPDDQIRSAAEEEYETDLTQNSEWDLVANQIFGYGSETQQPQQDTALPQLTEMDEMPSLSQPNITPPVLEDISMPQPVASAAPAFDELSIPEQAAPSAPAFDEMPMAAQPSAPTFDEIPMQHEVPTLESLEPSQKYAPAQDDFLAQFAVKKQSEPENDFSATPSSAPAFDEMPMQHEIPTLESLESPQQYASAQDDFLAQFTVEKPSEPENNFGATTSSVPTFDEMPMPTPAAAPTAPVLDERMKPQKPEIQGDVLSQFAVERPDIAVPEIKGFDEPLNAEQNDQPEAAYEDNTVAETAEPKKEVNDEIAAFEPDAQAMMSAEETQAAPVQEESEMKRYTTPDEQNKIESQKAAAAAQTPQIISVPQFAGYDVNGQPVYTYVQMQMTGLDANGQPMFAPIPGQQPMPAPQFAGTAQPQIQPGAPMPQAAAPAPKPAGGFKPKFVPKQNNGQPSANISKIAVNPHAKSTSQAFVNAIASSKDYANKNLIETQGLRANSPVLTSIEDVLSTMGDDTLKKQQVQKQAMTKQNVNVGNEYKVPARSAAPSRPASMRQPMQDDIRFMSKSELKAKKKQDKIDAKFKKEMSKRGF